MRVFLRIAIISLLAYLLLTPVSHAQEVIAPAQGTDATLHDSPPGLLPGAQRGQATDYARYMVLEGRRVQVFFDYERWLKVVPLTPDNTLLPTPESFWIRWGRAASSGDFIRVDVCDANIALCDDLRKLRELRERIANTM